MRYLRTQTLSRRSIPDSRLYIGLDDGIVMNTNNSMSLPFGPTSTRPVSPTNGMIRFNTDLGEVELYQANSWRSLRFKESANIIQQTLGAGDSNSIYYGPLNPAPPVTTQSGSTWGGQNLIVLIENVMQLATTNYTVVENPVQPADTLSGSSSIVTANNATTLYFNASTAVLSAITNNINVTLTFNAKVETPYAIDSIIIIENCVPDSFNGAYQVISSTVDSVTVKNPTMDTLKYGGVITSTDAVFFANSIVGFDVSGTNIQPNTKVVSYTTNSDTNALLSIELDQPVMSSLGINSDITLTSSGTALNGYYLKFGSPVPNGKMVTVLHGFDN
jgi:hypothetical protein